MHEFVVWLEKVHKEFKDATWLHILLPVLGFIATYIAGIILLLTAGRRRPDILANNEKLAGIALKPLEWTPKLGGRLIFSQYRDAVLESLEADRASAEKENFGLPALGPDGEQIPASADLPALCEAIAEASRAQQPVFVKGVGGAGKTTVLRRTALLALKGYIFKDLEPFHVVCISREDATDSLAGAVTRALRRNYRLPVTVGVMTSQMQSANFLILFDDFGEMPGENRAKFMQAIADAANDAFFRCCRFIFFSRPNDDLPQWPAFTLAPLNRDFASRVIDWYESTPHEARSVPWKESLLTAPVSAGLLIAFMESGNRSQASKSTPTLVVEEHVRALLRLEGREIWSEWRSALASLANLVYLEPVAADGGVTDKAVLKALTTILPAMQALDPNLKDAIALREKLRVAGVLTNRNGRWQFAHPLFAQHFAAQHICQQIADTGKYEALQKWKRPPSSRALTPLFDILRETMTSEEVNKLTQGQFPVLWQSRLAGKESLPARVVVADKEFVLVPGGKFKMGTTAAKVASLRSLKISSVEGTKLFDAELFQFELDLNDFYISRFPVTNGEYRAFIVDADWAVPSSDSPGAEPYSWNADTRTFADGQENHPVVCVSWHDAQRYCAWRGNLRLATEAEWERAARGIDAREWPWGSDWRPRSCNCEEEGLHKILPVGSFTVGDSAEGVSDLAGNVLEWCSSVFSPYPYVEDDGREDPNAPGDRVLRGGAFTQSKYKVRGAFRHKTNPWDKGFSIGFRVVLSNLP